MNRSKFKTFALATFVIGMAIALITYPQESLEASKIGLSMWWEVVFPSLLPFFIVSEMLIGFGVVKFIGVLLEPLMRPLFRVPGVGGFAWAMGMASGFPAGAKITARLRQEKQITAIEAERLVSFTNASNPLFIFGAIAVGFFGNPNLGIILALSHYLGNFCVGLIMRFHGPYDKKSIKENSKVLPSLPEAFKALHHTRLNDKRPIGKLLGDAVITSIQTLLMIGGFIILFSVFNRLLLLINITDAIAFFTTYFLQLFNLPADLSIPLISGIFEITLGSKLTSQETQTQLLHQLIITSFILGFSGFSIHAQVASILADTDIRFKPFFFARILQGFLSSIIALLLWKPLYVDYLTYNQIVPVLQTKLTESWTNTLWDTLIHYGPTITLLSLSTYVLLYAARMKKI
ncbi:sporulation integral membrane protein YlbJ [Cytobacillus sp. S13-E01]|uniref:sporulation integral membrane protein YlbJ n=1 Tax=Cytobacillus sp. S13-E01 TaxID=3031326 RepID=UPI0023D8467C|nr:sporulation integral membrane protein YlbJ [Cytobacillus sp. S13-E01]MDF0725302.1 sporulation integral membrane protein YlbJ [Cytobacillus sp. S13-E01]